VGRARPRGGRPTAEAHRPETLAVFGRHGLDDALAGVLYALDADPVNHPLYPDAAPVLRDLDRRGVAVAVVSDFHVDLRPMLASQGITTLILPPPPADLVPRGLDVVTRLVG